jgi:hypothetical protein
MDDHERMKEEIFGKNYQKAKEDAYRKWRGNGFASGPKKLESTSIRQIMTQPLNWLWHGHLLRGALELISGMPNIGKSQAQISLIASATTTMPWPNGEASGAPANVIMLTAEDTLDQIVKPRLLAAGADIDRIHAIRCIKTDDKERQFLLSEDLDALESKVAEIGDVALITVDPITAYMGSIDSHKATDVRNQLGPLKDFAEKIQVCVSAITHPPKTISPRAMDHFIGSQAFIAAARIGHVCVSELDADGQPTGRILFTSVKYTASNRMPTLAYRIEGYMAKDPDNPFLPLPISRVVWDTDVEDITADEAVAPMAMRGLGKQAKKAKAIGDFLYDMLKDGEPVKASHIYAEGAKEGFSRYQLKRAKDKLANVREVKMLHDGESGEWSWQMIKF